jgi:hypothetical protein
VTGVVSGAIAAGRADLSATADPVLTGEFPDRVAWLSGRSAAAHCALSPVQEGLLEVAARHGFEPVPTGFPFVPGPGWSRAWLGSASVRNARQYVALRRDRATAETVAARLRLLFAGTSSRLLVVCGSLGLELLLAGLRQGLPVPPVVRVVAFGPVASGVPASLDLWVMQGRLDPISRLCYHGPVRSRPWCGHLGYAGRPDAAGLVAAACRSPW